MDFYIQILLGWNLLGLEFSELAVKLFGEFIILEVKRFLNFLNPALWLLPGLDAFIPFLILKFEFIDFKTTKFKFIDFKTTKFKFIGFAKIEFKFINNS